MNQAQPSLTIQERGNIMLRSTIIAMLELEPIGDGSKVHRILRVQAIAVATDNSFGSMSSGKAG